jgi:hypothetical protein
MIPFRSASWVALLVAISALPASGADVTTLSGKKYSGTPVKFDAGILTIQVEGAPVALPAKDLLMLDFGGKLPTAGGKFDEVTLTDGTTLRVSAFKIKGKLFEPTLVTGPAGVPPPLPAVTLAKVFHILRGADQPAFRTEWNKLVASRGKRDLFVSRAADGVLSPLPGTVLEGSAEGDAVTFEREDGQLTTLQLRRATGGIIFNQPPVGVVPPTVCKVLDAFGNVLFAQSIEFADGGLRVKTVHGAAMTYPNLTGLVKLDFSQGNIAYLSDLDPVVTAPKAIPEPGEFQFTYLKDRSQRGGPIRLAGVTYPRGLWIYPETSLVYKLTSDYREFKTTVGIDDDTESPSSQVKVTIEGDGRVLFSGLITRKDNPKELVLDVKGVRELRIAVEQDTRFAGNQVSLGEARLQK